MDSTFVIPIDYQLNLQKTVSNFHISTNKDYLAVAPPIWLQAFVVWELVFQLPFFIYAVYDYLHNAQRGYSKSLWCLFLLYGFNAGFTSLICVVEILFNGEGNGLNAPEVVNLAMVYLPTTIIPLVMMVDFIRRINGLLNGGKKKSV